MSKIEECFNLFKQYCNQEMKHFHTFQFCDDESGYLKDDEDNILIYFDNFEDCINQLKEKIK